MIAFLSLVALVGLLAHIGGHWGEGNSGWSSGK